MIHFLYYFQYYLFNNIIRESYRLRREKYENFLKCVNILSTMDSYEISFVRSFKKMFF